MYSSTQHEQQSESFNSFGPPSIWLGPDPKWSFFSEELQYPLILANPFEYALTVRPERCRERLSTRSGYAPVGLLP